MSALLGKAAFFLHKSVPRENSCELQTIQLRELVHCCIRWSRADFPCIGLFLIDPSIYAYPPASREYSITLPDSNRACRFSRFREMDRKRKEWQLRDAGNYHA
jgi:hypothetical protein